MGKKEIAKNTIVFFLGTLSSRILGFVRDILIANYFGAAGLTDAFFVAFRIPNLFRRLLGEGALSAAFIPVFSEYEAKGEDLRKIINSAFTTLLLVLVILLLLGETFTSWFVYIISPGFKRDPHIFELTVRLTRITFPYIFFMGMAILIGAALNYKRDFFYTSVSPVFLNISLIAAILLRNNFENPIFALAWGVFIGGVFQIILHFVGAFRLNVFPSISLKLFSQPVKEAFKLMLPATAGLAIHQINTFVDTIIASFLPVGSISYLYYANRLFQLPLALFGIGVGSVLLPVVSQCIANGQRTETVENVRYSVGLVLLVNVPAALGLIVFSKEIVDLLFRRGAFGYESVSGTAYALSMYALGLAVISVNKVLVSLYHGHKDMLTPVKASFVAFLANVVLNIILVFPLKHAGLALATSLASVLQLLYLLKHVEEKGYESISFFPSHLKKLLLLNSLIFIFMIALKFILPYGYQFSLLKRGLTILFYIASTLLVFYITAKLFNIPELETVEQLVLKKKSN